MLIQLTPSIPPLLGLAVKGLIIYYVYITYYVIKKKHIQDLKISCSIGGGSQREGRYWGGSVFVDK